MPDSIRLLPAEVIHRIAAGEVIDSPAAAVRELVENALDAKATRIALQVDLAAGHLSIADNGEGMVLSNLQQAACPHSTSKIGNCADLDQITSLGFRGEALHSLAQLAELQICSQPRGATEGWRVTYNHEGEPIIQEAMAMSVGTIVQVSRLFAGWSVRQQGLPNASQQLQAIQQVIYRLALCHPQVTWQVEQQNRPWFVLRPGATAHSLLPQILRQLQASDLREVLPTPDRPVYGLLGLPDRCHRRRPDWLLVAINGRCVELVEMEQTILHAFRRTLPRDRYPLCFVHLQVPPNQIDWNRHPAKSEVYLHHLSDWQRQVSETLTQALQVISFPDRSPAPRVTQMIRAAEVEADYRLAPAILSLSDALPTPDPAHHPLSPRVNVALKVIGQVHQTYIVVEHPTGLWLIEQHIAHERVLYEQLRQRWQTVCLEPPIILADLKPAQVEQLQRLQLEIEPFGEQLWAVRSAPAALAQRSDRQAALLELSQANDLEAAIVATACRSALRNGTPLTLAEMQTLVEQWQATQQPTTCPHGRPIYLPMQETSLARFFRRHWVIGKSHGI